VRGTMRALVLASLVFVPVACKQSLRAQGEECTTSAECQPTLLCDTALEPPSCQPSGSPRPDLSTEIEDLAGRD
jgi:hypothetical protein